MEIQQFNDNERQNERRLDLLLKNFERCKMAIKFYIVYIFVYGPVRFIYSLMM